MILDDQRWYFPLNWLRQAVINCKDETPVMSYLICQELGHLEMEYIEKNLQPELPKRCERWWGVKLIPLWQCQHVWPPWWAPTSHGEPSNITHVILWHWDQLFQSTFDRNVRQLSPFELREEVENKVQKSFDLRLPSKEKLKRNKISNAIVEIFWPETALKLPSQPFSSFCSRQGVECWSRCFCWVIFGLSWCCIWTHFHQTRLWGNWVSEFSS